MNHSQEKRRILLDANFLMLPGQFGVDIFTELQRVCAFPHELCIVQPVLDELRGIASGSGRGARAAELGLSLVERKGLKIVDAGSPEGEKIKNADEFMLSIVRRDRDLVATQDRELRRALKEKGIATVVLRKRRVLEIQR